MRQDAPIGGTIGAVPESNVQIARRGFQALERGEIDALAEILDPDVKWHGSEGLTADACHDRDQVLRFIAQARRRGAVGELVEVIDAGEQVVVVMRPPAPEGVTHRPLRANLTTFREGKVVRMVAYQTPEEAFACLQTPPPSSAIASWSGDPR